MARPASDPSRYSRYFPVGRADCRLISQCIIQRFDMNVKGDPVTGARGRALSVCRAGKNCEFTGMLSCLRMSHTVSHPMAFLARNSLSLPHVHGLERDWKRTNS